MGVIYRAIIQAKRITCPEPAADAATLCTSIDALSTESSHSSRGNQVKLPKLTIHLFNGNQTTWKSFWDSYQGRQKLLQSGGKSIALIFA